MKMPRIVLIGNCQIHSLAEALRFFCPRSFVKIVYSWETTAEYGTIDKLLNELATFDYVFAHQSYDGVFQHGGFDRLREAFPHLIDIPVIVFPAFHPDLIYLYHDTATGERVGVQSAIGTYNSALAVFGYIHGLSVDEVLGLYREDVYEMLGYFDFWPSSQEELLKAGRSVGIPLETEFQRWTRSGCFMHSINHPKAIVLIDVASALLRKAAITTLNVGCEHYITDNELADAVWPVYEPVARRYGLKGSNVFKKPDYAANAGNGMRFFDLRTFVDESYRSYEYFPRRSFRADRLDALMLTDGLRDHLLAKVTS